MLRLVLFDIDGTLIRTGGAGVRAFEQAFGSEFQIPNATAGLNFSGRTDSGLVRQIFANFGIDPSTANFQRFYAAYLTWLERLLPTLKGEACPGAAELIRSFLALPERPLVGLLTGNIRRGAELKLRHYGLHEFFAFGAYGDDHECRNHLAGIARDRGSELLGSTLSGDEILVVGDTPLDIACARAIEAKVLAVATGSHALEELRACAPTWVVRNFLETTVARLCGNPA